MSLLLAVCRTRDAARAVVGRSRTATAERPSQGRDPSRRSPASRCRRALAGLREGLTASPAVRPRTDLAEKSLQSFSDPDPRRSPARSPPTSCAAGRPAKMSHPPPLRCRRDQLHADRRSLRQRMAQLHPTVLMQHLGATRTVGNCEVLRTARRRAPPSELRVGDLEVAGPAVDVALGAFLLRPSRRPRRRGATAPLRAWRSGRRRSALRPGSLPRPASAA